MPPPDYKKIKLVVVGDKGTGKTAFSKVFTGQEFPVDYQETVGSDFYMKNFKSVDGLFQYNLWDLSGDPVYSEVRNEFYKESQAMILMYDISKRKSFESLEGWVKEA